MTPEDPEVAKDCLLVFASAGPLAKDDGADLGFLSARVTLTGATVHGVINRIAPRLATVMGQKLATQTVPVLGAAAGAATNYAYTSYYQQMAHVHFGLRKLAQQSGQPREALVDFAARGGGPAEGEDRLIGRADPRGSDLFPAERRPACPGHPCRSPRARKGAGSAARLTDG